MMAAVATMQRGRVLSAASRRTLPVWEDGLELVGSDPGVSPIEPAPMLDPNGGALQYLGIDVHSRAEEGQPRAILRWDFR